VSFVADAAAERQWAPAVLSWDPTLSAETAGDEPASGAEPKGAAAPEPETAQPIAA